MAVNPSVEAERRNVKRSRLLKGGIIAFSARHATIPCVLRDMSDTGARLQVAQGSGVPDTFELIVELDGLEVPCQVVWRKITEIGVTFLAEPKRVNPKRAQIIGNSGPAARSTLRRSPTRAPASRKHLRHHPSSPVSPAAPEHADLTGVPVAAVAVDVPAGERRRVLLGQPSPRYPGSDRRG
ncbi:MAG: PilZ domain-containing protein [Hyphomicrobiaceae bacterium]